MSKVNSEATKSANAFIKANKASRVVSGYLIQPNPKKTSEGASYTLADGTTHRLDLETCRALPRPYPKWLGID